MREKEKGREREEQREMHHPVRVKILQKGLTAFVGLYFFKLCFIACLFLYMLIKAFSNNQFFLWKVRACTAENQTKKRKKASFFKATLTFASPSLPDSLGSYIFMRTEEKG